jgi:hypothetical protein
MRYGFSNTVVDRDAFGRFRAALEKSGSDTVRDAIEKGAQYSREEAPIGRKHDKRTVPLRDSIRSQMLDARSGNWYSVARHALPIEYGADPHPIIGDPTFLFYWENKWRWWIPGLMGEPDVVAHPGNAAQPFLRPAYQRVMAEVMEMARRNYGTVR